MLIEKQFCDLQNRYQYVLVTSQLHKNESIQNKKIHKTIFLNFEYSHNTFYSRHLCSSFKRGTIKPLFQW